MSDIVSREKRSEMMSSIRGVDTKPELAVRKHLFRKGFRFRLHDSSLPGKPDLVLKKFNTVIFVNGCYWHRHAGCKFAYIPKSNVEFWEKKFRENISRDRKIQSELEKLGWTVLIVWECEAGNVLFLDNMAKLIGK